MSAAANFKSRVQAAIADQRLVRAVRLTTLRKVDQRAAGMAQLHDAEGLRTLAAAIKQHTLDHLGLEEELRANLSTSTYESGHMMYVRLQDLAKLKRELAAFIVG